MQTSIKWLQDYVEITEEADVLAEQYTMAGIPVEGIQDHTKECRGIIVVEVQKLTPHPQAEHLWICSVFTGSQVLSVVTGADNLKVGYKVPLAQVGSVLPSGKVIGAEQLRGVESQGMLCSADELGLDSKLTSSEQRQGIYLLSADVPLGESVLAVLGWDTPILEFELTPNRADCFSVLGLAREAAVLTGKKATVPVYALPEGEENQVRENMTLTVKEPQLCPRFAVRMLENVRIGSSPVWMQNRLLSAGMRPINNVVDVTNFVMLELGQPMHAYDYDLLAKHELIVRKALQGERLTTLDGVKRELNDTMLVIADAVQAVGVAGVMGGLATEVTASTQKVVLEAAAFNSASVRRTARELGLRSEASGRFERGTNVADLTAALDRAVRLLLDMGACTLVPGLLDAHAGIPQVQSILFEAEAINQYLGTNIPEAEMLRILTALGFTLDSQNGYCLTVPSWRNDVTGMADLAEEVARIYGYEQIPATTPVGAMCEGGQQELQNRADQIREWLTGLGFQEVINFSFMHPQALDKLNFPKDHVLWDGIAIRNPINDEFPWMRTTLLGGMLDTALYNLARKNESLSLYELGTVFWPRTGQTLPEESLQLCGLLYGSKQEVHWQQKQQDYDFYDAKGVLEALFKELRINEYTVETGEYPPLHPGKTAIFYKDGKKLAVVGELHPRSQEIYGFNKSVYVFECALPDLAAASCTHPGYLPLPKFPAVSRDLALLVDRSLPAQDVQNVIETYGGKLLKQVILFDVYQGDSVPEDKKSLAFSLLYQSPERTLTDQEVEEAHTLILQALKDKVNGEMRK